jgi:CHASE2 domain-containing sensor protein
MAAAPQPGRDEPQASPMAGDTVTAPAPTAAQDQPPSRVGHYEILEPLGRGGFGTVYLARHRILGVRAAVKILHDSVPRDSRRAFIREARRLCLLRGHPGIVELREFGFFRAESSGRSLPYFAADLVASGKPITRYASLANLDLEARLGLFARVCDAVHYAHSLGVIHLDLTPANILVPPAAGGRPPQPRIIDFGIARAADPARQRLDAPVLGTVEYMSPEQTHSGTPLDPRSDVYSLGVVLYELISGGLPYRLPAQREAAYQVVRSAPPDLSTPIPAPIKAVLAKAMAKDPAQRYSSADEMARDLRLFLAGGDPRTVGAGPLARTVSRVRGLCARRPRLASTAAALLSAAITLWVGVPLLFLTGTSDWYAQAVAPTHALRDVVLVARSNRSLEALHEPPPTGGSERGMCGRLMEQLADNPPRVVVFDFTFPGSSPMDPPFVRGVRRLSQALVPVVVGITQFAVGADGRPTQAVLSRDISAAVAGWGDLHFYADNQAPWQFPLLHVWPDADPYPSLALVAVAAAKHNPLIPPYPTPTYELRGNSVAVRYFRRTDHPSSPRIFEDQLTFLGPVCERWTTEEHHRPPERPGSSSEFPDAVTVPLVIPPEAEMESSIIPLEDVILDASAAQRCRDKVVIVYNVDYPGDVNPYPGGTRRGISAHAVAIQSLLSGVALRRPVSWGYYLIPLLGAFLGLALPWPITRRRSWWPVWAIVACAAAWVALITIAVGGAIVAARQFEYLFNPMVLVFAMLTTAALALVADWVRRSSLAH